MGRRIGGAGGGSDPAGKGTAVVVAAAIGFVAAAGSVATGGVTVAGSSVGSGSTLSRNISTKKAEARDSAKRGKAEDAWRRMGMRQLRKVVKQEVECLSQSFGRVREFFLHTPCRSLHRVLFGIGDGDGTTVVVSVVWVRFRNSGQAGEFRRLHEVHGSGDVKPLAAALLGLADVRFSGHHYAARPAGDTVVFAETEAAAGQMTAEALDAVAEVAVHLPR